MVDTKIEDLSEDSSPLTGDLIVTVDDPSGSPTNKKVQLGNVFASVGIVADTSPQLGGDLDLNGKNLDFPTTANISDCLDEDAMGTDSATVLATQQSIKAYVDSNTKGKVRVLKAMPPDATAATLDFITGGSTPAEQMPVWDFDSTTAEYADFLCRLESYAGGGLTFTIAWSADGTASGNVVWEIGIRAIPDDTEDMDGAHTYLYNQVIDAAPTVDGEVTYASITFTDGADMDSWADGELSVVRVRRLASDGSDTMNSNDAELWSVRGEET